MMGGCELGEAGCVSVVAEQAEMTHARSAGKMRRGESCIVLSKKYEVRRVIVARTGAA